MPQGNVSTYMYFKPSSKDVHSYVTNINFLTLLLHHSEIIPALVAFCSSWVEKDSTAYVNGL